MSFMHDDDAEPRTRPWWHPREVAYNVWRAMVHFWSKPSGIWFATTLTWLLAFVVSGFDGSWLGTASLSGLVWFVTYRQDLTNERLERVEAQCDNLARAYNLHRRALEELIEERDQSGA